MNTASQHMEHRKKKYTFIRCLMVNVYQVEPHEIVLCVGQKQ